VREAYLGKKGKKALHLETEVGRTDFEELIMPLLKGTLEATTRAFEDAKLTKDEIDRVILVGGSTRIPLVRTLIENHLSQEPCDSIEPDLCVALGAALQAGVRVGEAVEAILVDVIPHSLGISALVDSPMGIMPGFFSVIIPRNSVIPISRSEIYGTFMDNQEKVKIEVFQGENIRAEDNVPLGEMWIEGLEPKPAGDIQVEVHFDFDINGILKVTATERDKGQQNTLTVTNAGKTRLSSHEIDTSKENIDSLFDLDDDDIETETVIEVESEKAEQVDPELTDLIAKAKQIKERISEDKQADLGDLLERVEAAISQGQEEQISALWEELEDFMYYVDEG